MKGDGRRAKNVKGTLSRLIKLLFSQFKWRVLLILGCILITALVGVAPAVYVQTISSYIVEGNNMVKEGLATAAEAWEILLPSVLGSLTLMAGVYVIGLTASYLMNRTGAVLTQSFLNYLRKTLFAKMQRLPISYFDTHNRGDIMSHYTNDIDTIRQLAEAGPCVIIGRCADYALANNPNLLSLFISAPMDVRIERVAKRQNISPEKARQLILKTDKRRAAYYEYYSSRKWGSVESYHYCLDSSYLGLGRTVELIQTMIAHKEHPIPSPTEFDPTRPEDQQ
jgi:cytidylate kinase